MRCPSSAAWELKYGVFGGKNSRLWLCLGWGRHHYHTRTFEGPQWHLFESMIVPCWCIAVALVTHQGVRLRDPGCRRITMKNIEELLKLNSDER